MFRFVERQRYSLCREDLSQFLQARLPPCLPFGFAVLWFSVVLRDLHKFDVNASNLKRPAKVAVHKGKVDLNTSFPLGDLEKQALSSLTLLSLDSQPSAMDLGGAKNG